MPLDVRPKVAFICPYVHDTAPGQRFRVELFQPYLAEYMDFKNFYFLDEKTNGLLYKKGYFFQKAFGVLKGFLRRAFSIFELRKFDYIFIFREATPLGPPIIEWLLAKIFGKKLIYDFDDAIWISNTTANNSMIGKLKWHSKVAKICKWSYKNSCGNNYLKSYAERWNKNSFRIPTVVDTVRMHNTKKTPSENSINLGWTGSHSSLILLNEILPVLKKLREEINFKFLVIADKNPELDLDGFEFIEWNRETEIKDLAKIDVGIMPLRNDEWCKGKCGFKAIQYMSLGIPAVVSNLGVNPIIVEHGKNGFVCDGPEDWYKNIKTLLEDKELRSSMGEDAHKRVEENYSVNSILPDFLNLFDINVSQA